MIVHNHPQRSEEWHEARRGVITASRFKDARDKLKSGAPSKACMQYAMDLARERAGGKVPQKFQNAAMQFGVEYEPIARAAYEAKTGEFVEEANFITTDDGVFGASCDGFVGTDGAVEIKTLSSSESIFNAVVYGDISEYRDQCLGYLWLFNLQWVDLVIAAPDMEAAGLGMTVIRITRDEEAIQKLEDDLMKFAKTVDELHRAIVERTEAIAA